MPKRARPRAAARKPDAKPESREAVLAIARELARLRRGDHEADNLRRERADWERKEARRRAIAAAQPGIQRQIWDLAGDPLRNVVLPEELAICLNAAERLKGASEGN